MALAEKRVAVLVGEHYQELEFWYPVLRLRELGAKVTVVGADAERTYRSRLGYPVQPDIGFKDAVPGEFDAVVLPGGMAGDESGRAFVSAAGRQGAILAAISSGSEFLAAAGRPKGLAAAAPEAEDGAVVVDGRTITARSVDDVPAFFKALSAALEAA